MRQKPHKNDERARKILFELLDALGGSWIQTTTLKQDRKIAAILRKARKLQAAETKSQPL